MKTKGNLLCCFALLLLLCSCYEDMDDVIRPADQADIKEFIWRGMNNIYLYKAEVPDLANTRFKNQEELREYLASFSSPEELFYDGLVAEQDEFSFLVDDYIELEKSLDGVHQSNGMQYGLVRYSASSPNVLGYVRYVLPNTTAEEKGITRGDLFNTIDGVQLTVDNYSRLLEPVSYSLGLAQIDNGLISATGENVTLVKEEYATNPVFLTEIIPTDAGKVGYLMYNGFTSPYDAVLNDAFGMFLGEGITELIIDLRYNGGGSVETAMDLGSMVTGQFKDEVFYTEQWNQEYQTWFEQNEPEELVNLFDASIRSGEQINSLHLNRVYVLTTLRTASASELFINGLDPYIEVVQVGESTTGKFQASTTLYDSDDFGRSGASLNHTYAIQPLIYKTVNSLGHTDFINGLQPDIEIAEDIQDLGVLGNPDERLLQAALNDIQGFAQEEPAQSKMLTEELRTFGAGGFDHQKMYSHQEKFPPALELRN